MIVKLILHPEIFFNRILYFYVKITRHMFEAQSFKERTSVLKIDGVAYV